MKPSQLRPKKMLLWSRSNLPMFSLPCFWATLSCITGLLCVEAFVKGADNSPSLSLTTPSSHFKGRAFPSIWCWTAHSSLAPNLWLTHACNARTRKEVISPSMNLHDVSCITYCAGDGLRLSVFPAVALCSKLQHWKEFSDHSAEIPIFVIHPSPFDICVP